MFETRVSVLAAIVSLTVAGHAFAGADSGVDAYTCFKAKDLKDPQAMVYAPVPVPVNTFGVGIAECTVGKLSQVCMPANVNGHVAGNITVAECCFKVKCDSDLSGTVGVADTNEGGGDFNGTVGLLKPAQLCEPCIWALD